MQIANRTFNTDITMHSPPGTPPVAAVKPQKVYFCLQASDLLFHYQAGAASPSMFSVITIILTIISPPPTD